jgi:hypothetical protein
MSKFSNKLNSYNVLTKWNGQKANSRIFSPLHTHYDGTNPHYDITYKNSEGNVVAKMQHLTPGEAMYLKMIHKK